MECVLWVRWDAVLVQVESVQFALLGHAEDPGEVEREHHRHRRRERRADDRGAADRLGGENRKAAAVEKARERGGVVGAHRAGGAVLAAGE